LVGAALLLGGLAYQLSKEPPRYRTSATILLESRPDRVPVFQELSPFRPLPVQLAILQSRSLAEAVVENLPKASLQDLIEKSYHVNYTMLITNAYRRLRGWEPEVESPQQRALQELQRARVRFEASRGHGLVEITAEASRPPVALDIVNTYIEMLLARTRNFNADDARVSREFLEQQLADVKRALKEREEAFRAFTAAHGYVKVPERSQTTFGQLTQAERTLVEIETNRKLLQARLQSLREKTEAQKRAPVTPPAPSPAATPPDVRRLRDQLAQLETSLLDLRTRYTDEHPRVLLVRSRIAEVQSQLGAAIKEATPVTPAPGAVTPAERVSFVEQILALETSLQFLTAQEEALRKQAETLRKNLSGLSRSEVEYSSLVREVESQRSLHTLLFDKLTAARIREQGEMKVVKVIDPPGAPTPTASEKRLKFFGLALVLAMVVGAGVPAAVEWMYKKVETEDDVEAGIGLPVLAILPRLRSRRPTFTPTLEPRENGRPDDAVVFSEAVRSLRVAIQLAGQTENLRTVLLMSPLAGEGKSSLALSLALAFREAGQRVVLADTDFVRPTLHRTMKVPTAGGLVEVLKAKRPAEESLVPVGEGLWIASQGDSPLAGGRALLATDRLKAIIGEFAGKVDIVLCDSAPVLLIPESLFLATAVDGVILVAKAGSTGCRDLARVKAMLEGAGARIVGVVINQMPIGSVRREYMRYYAKYRGPAPGGRGAK
jgi:capsular exopolysaccharide synthesis family protein